MRTSHYALEIMAFHHVHLASTHFDNDLEITLVETSHNLWFHLYKPQLADTHSKLPCYEPSSVTLGGAPLYEPPFVFITRLPTSLATTVKGNKVKPIHASHNLHAHTRYPISLAHYPGSPCVYHPL